MCVLHSTSGTAVGPGNSLYRESNGRDLNSPSENGGCRQWRGGRWSGEGRAGHVRVRLLPRPGGTRSFLGVPRGTVGTLISAHRTITASSPCACVQARPQQYHQARGPSALRRCERNDLVAIHALRWRTLGWPVDVDVAGESLWGTRPLLWERVDEVPRASRVRLL